MNFGINDTAWLLVCTSLVFLMKAEFSCFETGLVRSNNSINVAIKNIVNLSISSALLWTVGFAIIFGSSAWGLIGTSWSLFCTKIMDSPWLTSSFLTQLVFCGAATIIVSGAVAERMCLVGWLIVSVIISGLIYPILGHWAWSGLESGVDAKRLTAFGFIDFPGSTVVHSVGAWVGLAAAIIIGARLGCLDTTKHRIHGFCMAMSILGVLILWFGWFGVNGGSKFGISPDILRILVNTSISAIFGGLTALGLAWWQTKHPQVEGVMNGGLPGLVGVTASCNIVTTLFAAIIGVVSGVVYIIGINILEKLKIDDVVSAFSIHCGGGSWGTIAVAFFGNPLSLVSGIGRWEQFGIQLLGAFTYFAWSFGLGYVAMHTLKRFYLLDVKLMDVQMTKTGRFEATSIIRERENKVRHHTPIIAMTADAMIRDRQWFLDAGINAYIPKPLQPDVLMELVEKSEITFASNNQEDGKAQQSKEVYQ